MQHQQASLTAMATAYLRAAHQILDPKPLILEDPAAIPLLGAGSAEMIQDTQDRYREPGATALRSHKEKISHFKEEEANEH